MQHGQIFKITQSWFWWTEKMKLDSPCRAHQVLLEIHQQVSFLWKTSKILLFKLKLHHCHTSVSTPSSAPSCCLFALSLLLSATLPCPTPLLLPPISCSQGWSQGRQPWWSLSAQDLPAAGLESLRGWRGPVAEAVQALRSLSVPRASRDLQHCPLQPRRAAAGVSVQMTTRVHGWDPPGPSSTCGLQRVQGCCCSLWWALALSRAN